jgi:hypothetical protein
MLLLAGCSQPEGEPIAGEPLACALDGAAEFARVCRAESQIVAGGTILIVRHPDGGFRRFEIEGDIVRTADGVDPTVTVRADATEVAVGSDRYLLLPPAPPVDAGRR